MKNFFVIRSYKKFSRGSKECSGRTVYGNVTVFSKKKKLKRLYRMLDYNRVICSKGRLVHIYKDKFRTGLIGQVYYLIGVFSLILLAEGVKIGDWVWSRFFEEDGVSMGSVTFIGKYIIGTLLYHIELYPGGGAKLARAAGSSGFLYSKYREHIVIKLRSGVLMKLSKFCSGALGVVSNKKHWKTVFRKAGVFYNLGWRPIVRGVAMNPVDHPHGGGEGKKSPKFYRTPWGKLTKGQKTRKKKKLIKVEL